MNPAALERTSTLSLPRGRGVVTAALSPDGALVLGITDAAVGGNPTITCWEAATGAQVAAVEPPKATPGPVPLGSPSAAAVSPDGRLLALAFGATGGLPGLGVWSIPSLEVLWYRGPDDSGAARLRSLAFSPQVDWLAGVHASQVKGAHRPYRLYWYPAGEFPGPPGRGDYPLAQQGALSPARVHERPLEDQPRSLAYSPQGTHVAVSYVLGASKGVVVWGAETPAEVARYQVAPKGWAGDPEMPLAFSPDGRVVATRHSQEREVALWDWSAGSTRVLSGLQKPVSCLDFQPGGPLLAAGSADGSVHVWDWTTGTPALQLAGRRAPLSALRFSTDGQRLVALDTRAGVEVWRLA